MSENKQFKKIKKEMDDAINAHRPNFNDWFGDLILACDTCAERDVLRNQKENLWNEWLEIKPDYDSTLNPDGN